MSTNRFHEKPMQVVDIAPVSGSHPAVDSMVHQLGEPSITEADPSDLSSNESCDSDVFGPPPKRLTIHDVGMGYEMGVHPASLPLKAIFKAKWGSYFRGALPAIPWDPRDLRDFMGSQGLHGIMT
jgi:hypothetical protein